MALPRASAQSPQPSKASSESDSAQAQPITTIKVHTRSGDVRSSCARSIMVKSCPGSRPKTSKFSRKLPPKRDRRPQKISVVQLVSLTDLNGSIRARGTMPPGVYSNMVAMQKVAVPPTVLLMDGLNTDVSGSNAGTAADVTDAGFRSPRCADGDFCPRPPTPSRCRV